MKNYLLLSMLSVGVIFASCRKANDLQPGTTTPAISQEAIDDIAKKGCKHEVPLKGDMLFTISESYNLPCDCGNFMDAGTYAGTGNISHLGKTTSYFKPCVAPIFQGNILAGYHVGIQCGSLKAANGDVVNVNIHPYNLMFTNAGAVGNVVVDIIGGTGKFKHAKGHFTAGTTNDGQGNVTLDNINGKISY